MKNIIHFKKKMTIFYDDNRLDDNSFSTENMNDKLLRQQKLEMTSAICHFCLQNIVDKYYFEVDGLLFHNNCLRCNVCQVFLSNMGSCFRKNKKLWCKQDYIKQYKCQKCMEFLKSSDLVMRSGNNGLPYHVGCFQCDICDVLLLTGDFYGCSNNQLFCKNDYLLSQKVYNSRYEFSQYSHDSASVNSTDINMNVVMETENPLSALCQLNVDEYVKTKKSKSLHFFQDKIATSSSSGANHDVEDGNLVPFESLNRKSPNIKEYTSLIPFKVLSDQKSNLDDLNLGNEIGKINKMKIEKPETPLSNYETDEKNVEGIIGSSKICSENELVKDVMDEASSCPTDDEDNEDDSSEESCCESEDKVILTSKQGLTKKGSNNLRQKRVRTSFKHQQLRTMKAYFSMNHNPDSKDLRQLSQKTGLSKRVLQVWFQNARAKFRRSLCRQTGVMCTPSANHIQMPSVFDEVSLISIDKNGNYSTKTKMTSFTDISSTILNHSIQNNHRLCQINDMNYQNQNNGVSLLPVMNNLRDRYFPNGKQPFIPITSYYNASVNPVPQNSPPSFTRDVGNLAPNLALTDHPRDTKSSFPITELDVGQKTS